MDNHKRSNRKSVQFKEERLLKYNQIYNKNVNVEIHILSLTFT
jgi:hypothetical protein